MLNALSEDVCQSLLQILWKDSVTGLALVKEDGSFYRANPAFCRITEYTEAELRKLRFQDITLPKDLSADEEMAKLVVAGEYAGYDMNKSYITKTGRIQPVFLRVTGMKIDGKFMYFVGEVAPLDRRAEPRQGNEEIEAAAARAGFFRKIKDNLPVILTVLGGLGILFGYATGLLKMKTGIGE